MRKLAVVMAVLALAGCDNEVEGVHKQVAEHLQNPKTAKFANVRFDTQGSICGQVRGKDDAGQFEPYRSYVAIKHDGQYEILIDQTGNNLRIREVQAVPNCSAAPTNWPNSPRRKVGTWR